MLICARLSIWNTPTVSAAQTLSKVAVSPSGMWLSSKGRRSFWPMKRIERCSALSMPSARMSTLISPSTSRSSLSHWITLRSAMAAFSTGTSRARSSRAMTKPPGCWLRWRGKPISTCVSSTHSLQIGDSGSKPFSLRRSGEHLAAVEPLSGFGHRVDAVQVDAQRAAHVAQRAARPVADDHAGQRRAVPAVLAVDVLDDLLAALVLEIDVDVRRLVALGADEAARTAAWRAAGPLPSRPGRSTPANWPRCRAPGTGCPAHAPSARCRPR